MGYAVNEEGVVALKALAGRLQESIASISRASDALESAMEANRQGLGPHAASVASLIADTRQAHQDACSPILELSGKVGDLANDYQEFIDMNRFAGGGSGSSAGSASVGVTGGSANNGKQSEHRTVCTSREDAIAAIMSDIESSSGKRISDTQAEAMLNSIQAFTGNESTYIREAYNNNSANPSDIEALNNLDEYLHNAPKWEGKVYRGINVNAKTAKSILSGSTLDMLGPSSWSSDELTAKRFSRRRGETVNMVFVLEENKSGSSITHVSSFNGAESEVLAPSGVIYHIDRTTRIRDDNEDYIYVHVYE